MLRTLQTLGSTHIPLCVTLCYFASGPVTNLLPSKMNVFPCGLHILL